MAKIAVLGYGTVGSGVVEVLDVNKDIIAKRAGEEISVRYVLDLKDFPGTSVENLIVHDFEQIVCDKEIEVVVEVMGGIEPAYTFVKRSLEAGKSVVTSNKALVAKHGAELLKTAKEHHVNFLFESSVGGGIPIIRSLNHALTGDVIEEITGILNGTTNYMMTKMFYDGADYAEVLKEAQDNGYAERNPEADVEGYDACRKIAILSSIISGKYVNFEDIYTEGITKMTTRDIRYAKKMGMTIKLLASAKREDDELSAIVAPFLLMPSHPLYNIDGVFNSVFVKGNMLGDAMFYGSGAGKLPTASAVVGDIVDVVKNRDKDVMAFWTEEALTLENKGDAKRKFFVRMKGQKEELLEKVETVLGPVTAITLEDEPNEFGFITRRMKESAYEAAAAGFSNILQMIRVEE